MGKIMVGIGLLLVAIGLGLWFFAGKLSWFGHLPGDIRIEQPNFRFYAPLTSMIRNEN